MAARAARHRRHRHDHRRGRAALGVSEMTIRRDLAELEERGARPPSPGRREGGRAAERSPTRARPRHGRSRGSPPSSRRWSPTVGAVAFDASSTVMRLATALGNARDLTVLTNGPDTFSALQDHPGVTALLTGGQLDRRTGSLVGPLACRSAAQLTVKVFFASAAAVDPNTGALGGHARRGRGEAQRRHRRRGGRPRRRLVQARRDAASPSASTGIASTSLVTELDPHDERLAPYRDLTSLL